MNNGGGGDRRRRRGWPASRCAGAQICPAEDDEQAGRGLAHALAGHGRRWAILNTEAAWPGPRWAAAAAGLGRGTSPLIRWCCRKDQDQPKLGPQNTQKRALEPLRAALLDRGLARGADHIPNAPGRRGAGGGVLARGRPGGSGRPAGSGPRQAA